MDQLKPGDSAPEFTLLDADQRPVSLADFAGSRVIVYFFPAALTPGCTVEAVDFQGALPELTKAGFQVIGISPDTPEKLARFRDTEELDYGLLSDPGREAILAYSAYGSKILYGKPVEGVLRSTFVIDVDAHGSGRVENAWYDVRANGHVEKLRENLGV